VTELTRIEDDAATRYVSWDHALWTELVDGPGDVLSRGLLATGEDAEISRKTLESWLKLGAEAIGCGYLVPARAGAQTVLTRLWTRILPERLPAVPADRRSGVLASCWNLGENLETSPSWLRRIFLADLDRLGELTDLSAFVAGVAARIYEPPPVLGARWRAQLVDLGREDRRFLPGELQFVSPRVVCVSDRLSETSVGIWLLDPPVLLGPMPRPTLVATPPWRWDALRAADHRISAVHRQASSPGFAVATLVTSQHLVVVRPEAG
jgi:hypothetical protein